MVDKKKKQEHADPDDVTQAAIALEEELILPEEENPPAEGASAERVFADEPDLDLGGSEELQEVAAQMTSDVPVRLVAVLGRKTFSLQDLLKLKLGQVVNLERPPNEIVDLVANGKLVARGELVEIDGQMGVKVIKVLK